MIAAVVQARMGSTRFPGKTLADIEGKPMLERFIDRLKLSKQLQEIVIATTTEPRDDAIAQLAKKLSLKCYRGSEQDVLDRFFQAAKLFGVKDLVRVTCDCPLIDPAVIDQVVSVYQKGSYDYVSNTQEGRFPDGMDVEVFSFSALERSHAQAKRPVEREHVTPFIRTSGLFKVGQVKAESDYSGHKWSVDDEQDLNFVRSVYRQMGASAFGMSQILEWVKSSPAKPEAMVNEGYYLSLAKEPIMPPAARRLQISQEWLKRSEGLIPGQAQTFSKGPTQFVQGVAPSFLHQGRGCHVWDVDGNEYIDCTMGLGAVLLGFGDKEVDQAVVRQLSEGVSFSLPHPIEVEVAEILREVIPCAEMVRFGKNGSDVTSGAVRLARAVTGREMILCCGYHGWQDWFIGSTTRNRGVPGAVRELTVAFEYNHLEKLAGLFAKHRGEVAAVIMEPIGVEEPKPGYLNGVKELCRKEGAFLIFDEVLTGVRFGLSGAGERLGVTPDLACFGKGLANGFPLSALVGRREIMKLLEEVFFSFTFGGEAVALAAAKATLTKLKKTGVGQISAQGQRLKDGTNVFAKYFGLKDKVDCVGLAPRTIVRFKGESEQQSLQMKSLFQQECLKRGILFTGVHLLSLSHTEADVDQVLRVYRAAMEELAKAFTQKNLAQRLEGSTLEPVFRQA